MNNNQTYRGGVIVKSHPKSIIYIAYSSEWYKFFNEYEQTHNGKPITVLQVAPLSESKVILEFVYNEDYIDDLKEQI